jgi:hypothetical protein
MVMPKSVVFLLALLCCTVRYAVAMSVDEAYRSIPHQKTDFDPDSARMHSDEAVYLDSFLALVNAAIVERVQALQWFSSGGAAGKSHADYRAGIDSILADFSRLSVPGGLQDIHTQVVTGVQLQLKYFEEWAEKTARGDRFRFYSANKHIVDSSRHLRSAYRQLIKRYPQATRNNRQAFYDYLCALDFI